MTEWAAYFLPDALNTPTNLTIISAALAAMAAYVIGFILTKIFCHLPVRGFLNTLIRLQVSPIRVLLPLMAMQTVWGSPTAGAGVLEGLRHLNAILIISTLTWMLLRAIAAVEAHIVSKNPVNISDNLRARKIQTQARVMTRSLSVLALIMGIAGILTTFPAVRQVGTSLLASAGLAGIVVGFAARPVLANLIAGIQIAITQPIRLDDVVIIENEWGRIEEITGTYVVVKIWDNRRLVVPLQWIIENPFQNWTRQTSSLIGSVFLWVDYSVPIEALRAETERLCKEVPHLWDGQVCVLQVTDCSERAMQIRVLGSSVDSSRSWDLRCYLRENLLTYITRNYPHTLPVIRTQMQEEPSSGRPA